MNKIELEKTHQRIKPYVHNTPVLTSQIINKLCDAEVYFKCENFQKMGAFKMRGAVNAILCLNTEQKTKGVVTHSSGNFAQALSLASNYLGVNAYIVMPKNAPKVKKAAVRSYGGVIIESDNTTKARETMALKVQNEKGATFIHPSNDTQVIYGQGTAAIELLKEYDDLDYLMAPIGGGGLIAGTILAAQNYSNQCKVIGAEPKEVDDAYRSLKSGKIESNDSSNTIADGLRTYLGSNNFPIIKQYIQEIICVDENEIVEAMKLV
ncbi:pyridoxal-phosphate dependent enzyme [Flavobacteriaceae bacterium]|nr:pyridoxal-phosphate dependent enzyme [Flavobacteriaceae bacterium]